MSEAARVHAFDALVAAAAMSASATAGVTIAPRRPGSMLDLRGSVADPELARVLLAHLGVVLPPAPNTALRSDASRVLWLGPDEWLLVSAHRLPRLPEALGDGTVVDVSHGRGALRLWGPNVRDALAKGCPLDLHPRVFPVDRCAQTAIAKVPVILDHVQPEVFDLYCPRSYAGSFWHWLTEACDEYGCAIAPPL